MKQSLEMIPKLMMKKSRIYWLRTHRNSRINQMKTPIPKMMTQRKKNPMMIMRM